MRVANLAGRLVLITDGGAIDVEVASAGRFGSDPQAVYDRWVEFRRWVAELGDAGATPFDESELGAPVPRPAQVFAIGANYAAHVSEFTEERVGARTFPIVFTKFPSSLTGPFGDIELPSGAVDWEVELVVVIGRLARNVAVDSAWEHVAGLTVGQDISDREVQFRDRGSHLSIAKSRPGFSPIGPCVVTPDSFDDPDDLALSCSLDGEQVQDARTNLLLYPVPELIATISALVPMLPGDLVFTGTPGGVGAARKPLRFMAPGQELVSRIEGIGEMRHTLTGAIAEEDRRRDLDSVAQGVEALTVRIRAAATQ